MYFVQEMIKEGQPGGALNRLVTVSAEDVGLADPTLVRYVGQCYDEFESWEERTGNKRSKAFEHQEARSIIDRAAIAASLCYKSRLLPMISFATLYNIYRNETFNCDLEDYQNRFLDVVRRGDAEKALYYAYIIKEVFESENFVLETIKNGAEGANVSLINDWIGQYTIEGRKKERLLFVGIILMLFRELDYEHGEYMELVDRHLAETVEETEIPDRAYDKHTIPGKRRGRGLEHFFNEGVSVKKERFPNDWEDRGRQVYYEAGKEKLGKTSKIIEAIKEKYENGRRQ